MLFHMIFFGIACDLYLKSHSADLNGIPLSTQKEEVKSFECIRDRG